MQCRSFELKGQGFRGLAGPTRVCSEAWRAQTPGRGKERVACITTTLQVKLKPRSLHRLKQAPQIPGYLKIWGNTVRKSLNQAKLVEQAGSIKFCYQGLSHAVSAWQVCNMLWPSSVCSQAGLLICPHVLSQCSLKGIYKDFYK